MIKKLALILSLLSALIFGLIFVRSIGFIWVPIVAFIGTYVLFLGIFILILWIMTWFIKKDKSYEEGPKIYQFFFDLAIEAICDYSLIKLTVLNKDSLPKEPYMMVFNHKSNYDPILQLKVVPKGKLVHISKHGNFTIPICGPFMHRLGFMEIDRENPRNAARTIVKAISYIKKGKHSVGISPEGTRNHGEGLLPFRAGAFKIALKAECPIVVCTFKGCEDVMKNLPFKKTRVTMNLVKVLPFEEIKDKNTFEIAEEVRSIMVEDLGIVDTNKHIAED